MVKQKKENAYIYIYMCMYLYFCGYDDIGVHVQDTI